MAERRVDLYRSEAAAVGLLLVVALAGLLLGGLGETPPGAVYRAPPVHLDPNRASLVELTSLPGVGRKTATRLVRGRPYRRLEDLRRVLGPRLFEALRPCLVLDPTPAGGGR